MKQINWTALTILTLVLSTTSAVFAKEEPRIITGSIPTKNLAAKDFPKAALINSSQAVKAATDAVPGHILSVGLENEDGYLVYAVEVVGADSSLHEINVDAGNAKILSQEKKHKSLTSKKHREDDDDDDDDEKED